MVFVIIYSASLIVEWKISHMLKTKNKTHSFMALSTFNYVRCSFSAGAQELAGVNGRKIALMLER
jgi:hypothetical protein